MKKLIKAHQFFVKETGSYLNGNEDTIKWKTKEIYFPYRGSKTYWYFPLTIKQKLYYPIAYFKFMFYTITGN